MLEIGGILYDHGVKTGPVLITGRTWNRVIMNFGTASGYKSLSETSDELSK